MQTQSTVAHGICWNGTHAELAYILRSENTQMIHSKKNDANPIWVSLSCGIWPLKSHPVLQSCNLCGSGWLKLNLFEELLTHAYAWCLSLALGSMIPEDEGHGFGHQGGGGHRADSRQARNWPRHLNSEYSVIGTLNTNDPLCSLSIRASRPSGVGDCELAHENHL